MTKVTALSATGRSQFKVGSLVQAWVWRCQDSIFRCSRHFTLLSFWFYMCSCRPCWHIQGVLFKSFLTFIRYTLLNIGPNPFLVSQLQQALRLVLSKRHHILLKWSIYPKKMCSLWLRVNILASLILDKASAEDWRTNFTLYVKLSWIS